MTPCRQGCDASYEYVGIDDGFGISGECVCDIYQCPVCGDEITRNCLCDDDEELTGGESNE